MRNSWNNNLIGYYYKGFYLRTGIFSSLILQIKTEPSTSSLDAG